MELKNRGVLVTGGASGLGAACVRLLAQAGEKCVNADRNSESGETLAAELREEGAGVFFACANVASEELLKAAVQTTIEKCGGVHVLINCAGIAVIEKVLGKAGPHSLESFQRVINVNLIGTFNAIRLAAAAMAENKPTEEGERGVIINTASIAAFDGQIGQAAYSASKGGIVGMTLTTAALSYHIKRGIGARLKPDPLLLPHVTLCCKSHHAAGGNGLIILLLAAD